MNADMRICSASFVSVSALFLIMHAPLMAQAKADSTRTTSATTELLLDGDDIVTTATRTPQRVNDAPEAVTVISAEDIAASGATSIPELLRGVPGVDVMEPNLSQQNVSIRGFNTGFANTVLVMVDGRRINEDIDSSVLWPTSPILISRIKRIEIVRGPGSVLYGADAFSGVINIILKTPMDMAAEQKHSTFVGQYENHSTNFAEGTYTASQRNDWAVTVGAGYHGVTGPFFGQAGKAQDNSSVPIVTLDVEKPTSRGSLTFSFDNADGKSDLVSGIVIKDAHFTTNTAALTYDESSASNPITARLYQSDHRMGGLANTFSDEFDIQQERHIGLANTLTYGASYKKAAAQSYTTGPNWHSENISSVFLQDEDRLALNTTMFVGARDDKNSIYGTQISDRLSLVQHLSPRRSLRLSYGTAFIAPTFIQTFLNYSDPLGPGLNLAAVGNAQLTPEKISSAEAGYRVEFPSGYTGISIFYNKVSDIIELAETAFAPPPFPAGIPLREQYLNNGTADAAGFELEEGLSLRSGWSALANYSFQHLVNSNGTPVDFSPDNKVNLTLQSDQSRRFNEYYAVHFVSNSSSGGQYIRAYTTVDSRLGYRLSNNPNAWTASIAVTNLLDDHHREYPNTPGQTLALSSSEPAQRSVRIELSGRF